MLLSCFVSICVRLDFFFLESSWLWRWVPCHGIYSWRIQRLQSRSKQMKQSTGMDSNDASDLSAVSTRKRRTLRRCRRISNKSIISSNLLYSLFLPFFFTFFLAVENSFAAAVFIFSFHGGSALITLHGHRRPQMRFVTKPIVSWSMASLFRFFKSTNSFC